MLARKLAALALSVPLAMAGTMAHSKDIVFAISAATGSLQQKTAAEFARLANERLKGKATVKLFADSQLGKDKDLLQKLKFGTVQITLPSSTMPEIAPEFALFDMPFLISDRDQLERIEKDIFWKKIAPKTEAKGYKVLAVWENGFRNITNSARPIDTPADLKGLKIRTPNSDWRVKMFKAWGASPTPMAFSEVFVALQTNVIDGQENPLTNIWAAKFNEVQKYLSLTGHVYSPAYPTVAISQWKKMPEDVRSVLEKTARDVEAYARKTGAEEDGALLAKLKAGGMKVNKADHAAFVKASKPIYDDFARQVPDGRELIDQALALTGSN